MSAIGRAVRTLRKLMKVAAPPHKHHRRDFEAGLWTTPTNIHTLNDKHSATNRGNDSAWKA